MTTWKEQEAIIEAKALKLREDFKALGIYPITQHPDYSNGPVYDINDIVEYLEALELMKGTK